MLVRPTSTLALALPLALLVAGVALAECSDTIDNDGDGDIDLADSGCTSGADPWEYPAATSATRVFTANTSTNSLDRFGESVAGIGDLDSSGVADYAVGAPQDDDGPDLFGSRGAITIFFADGANPTHKISAAVGGDMDGLLASGDEFGSGIAAVGDLDGDGVTDLAVGAAKDDDGALNAGAVWILFLQTDGSVASTLKISGTSFLDTSPSAGDILLGNFGQDVAQLGNYLDGAPDLAVGAPSEDDGGSNRGAVWLLSLRATGNPHHEMRIADGVGGLPSGSLANGDSFGMAVAGLGDIDGDEVADLAVGAPFDDTGGSSRGAVWILRLNPNGSVATHTKITGTSVGAQDGDQFGREVAAVGDLDGDGIGDLAVGATGDDGGGSNRGASYLLFLNADGTVRASRRIADAAGGMGALDDSDEFGNGIAAVGDLDSDGVGELVIGAVGDDDSATNYGTVWITELDAEPPVCGNGVLEPGFEECDDGNTASGDRCASTCEREDYWRLYGTAQGGSVSLTIDGVTVATTTTAAETADQVLANLAADINADVALQALGVSAGSSGSLLHTDGRIGAISVSDAGLNRLAPLELEGTITLENAPLPAVSVDVGGVGVAQGDFLGPVYVLNSVFGAGPIGTTSVPITDPGLFPATAVQLTAGFGSGDLADLASAVRGGALRVRKLPLSGELRICLVLGCAQVARTIPFATLGPTAAGLGGSIAGTWTGISTPTQYTVRFAPWTLNTVTVSQQTGPTTTFQTAKGFVHGPLSNTTTPGQVGGTLQFVTPLQVTTNNPLSPKLGVIARLELKFLPEPAPLLAFASGAAFLVLLGRRRARR